MKDFSEQAAKYHNENQYKSDLSPLRYGAFLAGAELGYNEAIKESKHLIDYIRETYIESFIEKTQAVNHGAGDPEYLREIAINLFNIRNGYIEYKTELELLKQKELEQNERIKELEMALKLALDYVIDKEDYIIVDKALNPKSN